MAPDLEPRLAEPEPDDSRHVAANGARPRRTWWRWRWRWWRRCWRWRRRWRRRPDDALDGRERVQLPLAPHVVVLGHAAATEVRDVDGRPVESGSRGADISSQCRGRRPHERNRAGDVWNRPRRSAL